MSEQRSKAVRRAVGLMALVGAVAASVPPAAANYVTFGFYDFRVAGDPSGDTAVGAQLSMTVWEYDQANAAYTLNLSSDQVLFTFKNAGLVESAISEIYFDDGFFGAPTIYDSLGGSTDFQLGAEPGSLPGANEATPEFVTDIIFNTQADNGSGGAHRVNNCSSGSGCDVLGLAFQLNNFSSWQAVIDALNGGTLRVGLHVQSINEEGSDSYLNLDEDGGTPGGGSNPVVPLPAALPLFGTALLGIGLIGYRRRRTVS